MEAIEAKRIETLRPMWDARKQEWKIMKKTYNGCGGWARFGGKFYASKHECQEVIERFVFQYPDNYREE